MLSAVAIILAYLMGSISFSILIAKKVAKIDIRHHGSGNAGATNTLRVLGKGPGILVLLLDALKGVIAIFIAKYVFHGGDWTIALSGLAAVLGHNWPVFFGFRGGKGVATTIGVLLTLAPIPALISVGVTLLVIAITRYVSVGSLVFMALIPVLVYFREAPMAYVLSTLLIGILGFIRHGDNIKRLIKGQERKLGQSRK
jgi:glycerol-3-phosphate acyltransferase PlsY